MLLWLTLFYFVAIVHSYPECTQQALQKKPPPEACRVPCNNANKNCNTEVPELFKLIYKFPVADKCENPQDGTEYTCYKTKPKPKKKYTYKNFPPLTNVYTTGTKQDQKQWSEIDPNKIQLEWKNDNDKKVFETAPYPYVIVVTPLALARMQAKHLFWYLTKGKEHEFEYVVMSDHPNQMRFQKEQHKDMKTGHTSLLTKVERAQVLGGKPLVHIAGNFKVNEAGYIKWWNPASGHFKPDLLPGMEEGMHDYWFNEKSKNKEIAEAWKAHPVTLDPAYNDDARQEYSNYLAFAEENVQNGDVSDTYNSYWSLELIGILGVSVYFMSLLLLIVMSFIGGLFCGYFGIYKMNPSDN